MAQTCSRCSRSNPAEARYCYFDGVLLAAQLGQAGPIDIGAQRFATPFVFPSGRACGNFDQLAIACQEEGRTAIELLQAGDLASFLGGVGRTDLARIAREAAGAPNKARGLDAFLAALPSKSLRPPSLQIEPAALQLGSLAVGSDRKLELQLKNQGMRLIYGTISCVGCGWLSLGDSAGTTQKMLQFSHAMTLPLFVKGRLLSANPSPLEGELVIEWNGGVATVPVRATVPVKPFSAGILAGVASPRQLAEKARTQPRDAAPFFENGAVAQWYRDNGWTYPVDGPMSSGLGGIQQFFEALGLAKPPLVELSQQQVELHGKPGDQVQHQLEVRTREDRSVYALARTNQPWLRVECPTPKGRVAPVRIVARVPDQPGAKLQAQLAVRSNGRQRFLIPVSLTIGSAPAAANLPPAQPVRALAPAPLPMPAMPTPVVPTAAVLPTAPAAPPSAVPTQLPPQDAQPDTRWLAAYVLPVGLLLLTLFGMFIRDTFVPNQQITPIVTPEDDPPLASTVPLLGLRMHNQPDKQIPFAMMSFGLVMLAEKDPAEPDRFKRLTFDELGRTNNVCIRLDGKEHLFGIPLQAPGVAGEGRWQQQEVALGKDKDGRQRDGFESIWLFDAAQVRVVQTVEIVPGWLSRRLDTCLIRYRVENQDSKAHRVGLRFLLDTFIGVNDGVPFTLPGETGLCDTVKDFRSASEVPDFIQALERDDLARPGTIAHLHVRLGGQFECPQQLTLGAWPNEGLRNVDARCKATLTRWQVPVLSMKTVTSVDPKAAADSAVVLYWPEDELKPGASREMGFTYGLGNVASGEGGGRLALTVGGSFVVGGEFTVTAYVSNPTPNQRLTLQLPEDGSLKAGNLEQPVPVPPPGATSRNSPVTWKVRAAKEGKHTLKVTSNTGASQTLQVPITRKAGIFD